MLQVKPFLLGKLTGTIYDFQEIGDVLPMHTHGEADIHISIIARGSFRMHGNGWESVAKTGDVVDWQPNKSHEFISLEASSRLVNIVKS